MMFWWTAAAGNLMSGNACPPQEVPRQIEYILQKQKQKSERPLSPYDNRGWDGE